MCAKPITHYTVPANRPFRPVFAPSEKSHLRKSNSLKGHRLRHRQPMHIALLQQVAKEIWLRSIRITALVASQSRQHKARRYGALPRARAAQNAVAANFGAICRNTGKPPCSRAAKPFYRITALQWPRDAAPQEYRPSVLPLHRHTVIPLYRSPGKQVYRSTVLPLYRRTAIPHCSETGLTENNLAVKPERRRNGTQANRHAGKHENRHTGKPAGRNKRQISSP